MFLGQTKQISERVLRRKHLGVAVTRSTEFAGHADADEFAKWPEIILQYAEQCVLSPEEEFAA